MKKRFYLFTRKDRIDGYGTHVEIGAALALGKTVILHAPNRKVMETPYPCVFHYHPAVKLLISETLDAASLLALMPSVP